MDLEKLSEKEMSQIKGGKQASGTWIYANGEWLYKVIALNVKLSILVISSIGDAL